MKVTSVIIKNINIIQGKTAIYLPGTKKVKIIHPNANKIKAAENILMMNLFNSLFIFLRDFVLNKKLPQLLKES
ncbi:hypothetical protein [Mariniphaga sp.]|uniref:hypothetical protein n=1 Tax=Mariniphaga sp. TaxID=1954475 RepID=UPI003562C31F